MKFLVETLCTNFSIYPMSGAKKFQRFAFLKYYNALK